ncbi:hypothetical protein AAFF_G00057300 [Aldrovandia affinis]|uniref:Uncharacterized protein n=1 Tax=Aldrovandia affinis TaxID=143900 RepID=A0AAD7S0V1_9TELE|nr:hypothetical protein AAFF_G00057300 [Aldrovandia affinis]
MQGVYHQNWAEVREQSLANQMTRTRARSYTEHSTLSHVSSEIAFLKTIYTFFSTLQEAVSSDRPPEKSVTAVRQTYSVHAEALGDDIALFNATLKDHKQPTEIC